MNLSSGFCYFKYVGTLITPQTHAVKGNRLKKTPERLICFVGLFLQHIQCLHSFDYLRQCNLTFFCFRNWEFLNCLLWISLKMYLYWVHYFEVLFNFQVNINKAALQDSHVNITQGQLMSFSSAYKCCPLSTFLFGLQCVPHVQPHGTTC